MRPRTQKVGWQLTGFSGGFRVRISTPVKHQPLQPATGLCIIIIMAIELERMEKPLRKLRKILKEWPSDPPPEMVHKLRTQTRRTEAIVSSFMLDQEPEVRRLLKAMKPVRKAA